jgi:hypothetical protein
MKLRARLLRVVRNAGPVKQTVLRGVARKHPDEDFALVFSAMRHRGELVMHGDKRGAKWGLP